MTTALPEMPSSSVSSGSSGQSSSFGALIARGVGRAKQVDGRIDQVDARALGPQQAGGLVDGPLQDCRQVGRGADPGADLAQRALRLGALGQLRPRRVEGLDEPGVGHRRRRVIGEGPDQRDLGGVEGRRSRAEGPERTEDLVRVDERGGDHGPDPDVLDDPVRVRGMVERRVDEVVVGADHGAPLDGIPEHAGPDRQPDRADPRPAAGAADAGVVREPKVPGLRIEDVDHRPVGLEQARRLGDGGDQLVVGLAVPAVGIAPGGGLRPCGGPAVRRGDRLRRSGSRDRLLGRGGARRASARCSCGHGPRIRRLREYRHRRSPTVATSSGRWTTRHGSSRAVGVRPITVMSVAHRRCQGWP